MDSETLLRLGEYILKVPYFLGLPSVRFNKTNQLFEPISNVVDKLRCLFISSVMFVLKCILIIVLIMDRKNLKLARYEDCAHIGLASIWFLSLGFDLHFWRKFDNNLRLLNVTRISFNALCKRYGRTDVPLRKSKGEIALKLAISGFVAVTLAAPIICLFDTNVYIFVRLLQVPILPTCAPIVEFSGFTCRFVPSLDLQTILWIGFMMTTQFMFALCVSASFWFHSVLVIPMALVGTEILEELSIDADKEDSWTIPAVVKPPLSHRLHSMAQIIINMTNESVFQDLYPFAIVFYICYLVFGLSVIIKIRIAFTLKLTWAIILCIVDLYLYCFIVIPSLFTVYSTKFLLTLKHQCISRKRDLFKIHGSLRPLKIGIGAFATLDESTIIVLTHLIISSTVDLLLTIDLDNI